MLPAVDQQTSQVRRKERIAFEVPSKRCGKGGCGRLVPRRLGEVSNQTLNQADDPTIDGLRRASFEP